jgi:hypothetical protein
MIIVLSPFFISFGILLVASRHHSANDFLALWDSDLAVPKESGSVTKILERGHM